MRIVAESLADADGIVAFAWAGATLIIEVEAGRIAHVVDLPSQEQTLLFTPGHGPSLGQA